jgi:hypothetical protein
VVHVTSAPESDFALPRLQNGLTVVPSIQPFTMKTRLLLATLVLPLSGCISTQVIKAPVIADKTICIIDNPSTRTAFRDAYERQVRAKGYETKIVAPGTACATTSTYEADYGFHWGLYLSHAQITIYSNEKEVGKATYKAPYFDMNKHGAVEPKIGALVEQLLP